MTNMSDQPFARLSDETLAELARVAYEASFEASRKAVIELQQAGRAVSTTHPMPIAESVGPSFAARLDNDRMRTFIVDAGMLSEDEWERLVSILKAVPIVPPPPLEFDDEP